MAYENVAIMTAYYEAWNGNDSSELDRFVADDFVAHDPAGGPDFDREGLKQRMDLLRAMLRGFRLTPEHVLAQNDLVAYRWRTEGTFVAGNEWDNLRFLTAIGQGPHTSVSVD